MVSGPFERGRGGSADPTALKILVAGAFGVGKTTLVGAVSDIKTLQTEESLTEAGRPVDDIRGVAGKRSTTVAMDFGRITISDSVIVYLFGTPGQERFRFLWDELARGALGALILVDTRRLADSFSVVDFFETRGLPFAVAVNCFDGAVRYPPEQVRRALDLDEDVPVLLCDARERSSARDALVAVVEHALHRSARQRSAVS
ncbi:GTP-binding protein [Streptomyces xiamenensis]